MSLSKTVNFYGRFLVPFSSIGFRLKGLSVTEAYEGLQGQTLLVTGATGGIGEAIALGAASSGATVLAVGRSQDKLDALAERAHGMAGSLIAMRWDLSLAADVRRLAREVQEHGLVDGLVNNVGVLNHGFEQTGEGVDAMYATNILNPYILTEALIDTDAFSENGVIVNMASGGMYNAPQNLAYMEQGVEGYNGFAAYATHKRAQLVLSDHWTGRAPGLQAYTMHPGWVDTDGVKRSLPRFRKILKTVLRDAPQGADTALWLIGQRPETQAGALWFDRAPRDAHAYDHTRQPLASDADIIAKLHSDAAQAETGEPS
jgi:dehydrogenase/reductase SDR family member 12